MDLNLFDIKDRVAVMTGACGVLGTTIVKYFASQGVKMVLLDLERASELGEKIVSEIRADGGEACFLATDVLDKARLDRLVAHLSDSLEFMRPHRVPSLSADHPKYNPNGRYWQGGVWPGTTYMLIDGLWRKGYRDLAREIADNHYGAVFQVWKDTGTFWEYYAPEKIEPGFMARKDFVGWTGLPPVAVFIEYILGIKSDYSEGKIEWDVRHLEEHGIARYPFGPDGCITLMADGRKRDSQPPVIHVETNVPFDLIVTWGDDECRTVHVEGSGIVDIQ